MKERLSLAWRILRCPRDDGNMWIKRGPALWMLRLRGLVGCLLPWRQWDPSEEWFEIGVNYVCANVHTEYWETWYTWTSYLISQPWGWRICPYENSNL